MSGWFQYFFLLIAGKLVEADGKTTWTGMFHNDDFIEGSLETTRIAENGDTVIVKGRKHKNGTLTGSERL